MNAICFFSSYFIEPNIPNYIKVYLIELKKHCNEVVFTYVTDNLDIESKQFLSENQIKFEYEKNEGYDFGQWYKAINKNDIRKYDKVFLVNDSCVLFGSLQPFIIWSEKNNADMQSLTMSYVRGKHLQSYFLVINKPIFNTVLSYFNEHKIKNTFAEVIETYEIGLSKHLIFNGYKIDSFLKNDIVHKEFAPYFYNIIQHLHDKSPLIKYKILNCSYRKDELNTLARMGFIVNPKYYISIIKKNNPFTILNLEDKQQINCNSLNVFKLLNYSIKKVFYKTLKTLKPIFILANKVYFKTKNVANNSINKLFTRVHKTEIDSSVINKNEQTMFVNHKMPCNFNKSNLSLFTHFTNYETTNEHIFKFENVNITNDGIIFKNFSNAWQSFPHTIFRIDYGLLYILNTTLFYKRKTSKNNKNYILLFDFWSKNNYYHWIIDSLPRLLSVKNEIQQDNYTLLLPYNCPSYILSTLNYFEIKNVEFFKNNIYLNVKNVCLPYYLAGSGHIHPNRVLELKREFTSKIKSNTTIKRIYASRGTQKNRKVNNEMEVIKLLLKYDFEIVYFENYTFTEQVELTKNVQYFISSHGANMTNVLFMPDNAKVLELIREDNPNFCYWAVSSVARLNYYYQLSKVVNHDDLLIDINLLEENLKLMFLNE